MLRENLSFKDKMIRGILFSLVLLLAGTIFILLKPVSILKPLSKADRILVEKGPQRMTLFREGVAIRIYKVRIGRGGPGPKVYEGDNRTPEGNYIIDFRFRNSGFHRALHISYPNKEDRERAKKLGKSPGGAVMIHGLKNGFGWIGPFHRIWFNGRGCVVVTNEEIDEIWTLVPDGTPITIRQ